MLLTTYIRPKRLTWRVTFGLDDLPGGLPRRPEAAGGPGRRFAERARGRAIDGVGAVDVGGRRDRRRRAAIASARVASPSSNKNYQQPEHAAARVLASAQSSVRFGEPNDLPLIKRRLSRSERECD